MSIAGLSVFLRHLSLRLVDGLQMSRVRRVEAPCKVEHWRSAPSGQKLQQRRRNRVGHRELEVPKALPEAKSQGQTSGKAHPVVSRTNFQIELGQRQQKWKFKPHSTHHTKSKHMQQQHWPQTSNLGGCIFGDLYSSTHRPKVARSLK